MHRPLLEGRQRGLDLRQAVVNLLRYVVGFGIGLFELFEFRLKRLLRCELFRG